jgi:hypothetical protein
MLEWIFVITFTAVGAVQTSPSYPTKFDCQYALLYEADLAVRQAPTSEVIISGCHPKEKPHAKE